MRGTSRELSVHEFMLNSTTNSDGAQQLSLENPMLCCCLAGCKDAANVHKVLLHMFGIVTLKCLGQMQGTVAPLFGMLATAHFCVGNKVTAVSVLGVQPHMHGTPGAEHLCQRVQGPA